MTYKFISLGVLAIIWGFVSANPVFPQSYQVDCDRTLDAWRIDPRMRDYLKTHSCTCPPKSKQSPKCVPIGSGGSSGSMAPPLGKLSPSKQMAAGLMGGFFSGLAGNLFDDLSEPPDTSYQDAFRKQEEAERLMQQEIKQKALKRWLDSQAEAEAKRLQEETERRKKGEAILAKASIGSGELRMGPIGEGKLTPFAWNSPKSFDPAPTGQYDISKFTDMERLLCAAYFSRMAENAANSGDLERASFIGSQVNMIIQKNAKTTEIECKPPKEISTTMDMKRLEALNQKYTKIATLYKEIMTNVDQFQNIDAKLNEITAAKEAAGEKIKNLDKQIEAIQLRIQTAETPEKRTQENDLLAQALALKSEAEQQQQEAMESEQKLIREKQGVENELEAMKNKIKSEGQR